MVVLFRLRAGETNKFNGKISWPKGEPQIIWSENIGTTRKTWVATFGPGDDETEKEALRTLMEWASQVDRFQQWEIVQDFIVDRLLGGPDEGIWTFNVGSVNLAIRG